MNFLQRLAGGTKRQFQIVFALMAYDKDVKSTGTFGNWQNLIDSAQLMLFFLAMRVGFQFLRGSNKFEAGGTTDIYFNIVVFMATGFSIAFLFRNVAIKALSGIKMKAPLYYSRIKPLDILLGTSLNDLQSLGTLSFLILSLVWLFTWSFRMDSPGLAIGVYLLTNLLAIGFGICIVFLGKLNKLIKKVVKKIIQRVVIFTSGIFFATFEFPAYMRHFITWNPILHGVELFRYSINNDYPIPGISLSYLVYCTMITLGFSLLLYRTNESLLLESDED